MTNAEAFQLPEASEAEADALAVKLENPEPKEDDEDGPILLKALAERLLLLLSF